MSGMFGQSKRSKVHLALLERVEDWTRARFSLPHDDIVLVSEVACRIPGGPPLETIVVFWSDVDTHYGFRIFKPVTDVSEADLPVSWLKSALRDYGDQDCC